jgi:RNA polymerase sigma factor (sigma-70 family)
MIVTARPSAALNRTTNTSDHFVALLPQIHRQAARVFCELNAEAREDAMHEVIAKCFVTFARLVEQGRRESAYATPLANYAIKQFRDGRRVGSRLNARDAMSPRARKADRCRVVSLDEKIDGQDQVRAALVEDRTAGPAETAAARIDVAAWLQSLSWRKCQIAKVLAAGETTEGVAKQFGISSARVSQIRQELRRSWLVLQGE